MSENAKLEILRTKGIISNSPLGSTISDTIGAALIDIDRKMLGESI